MKVFSISKIVVFYCTLTLLYACVDVNLSTISDELDWEPSFSFPIATLDIGVDDYNGTTPFLTYYDRNQEVLISDYIDVDFEGLFDDVDYIEELTLRFFVENNFPARLECYAYYYDEGYNFIRTTFEEAPVQVSAATVDDNGDVKSAYSLMHDEYLFRDDDEDLLVDVRHILLVIYFKDIDTTSVVTDQLDRYNIDISLGIRTALDVPTNQ